MENNKLIYRISDPIDDTTISIGMVGSANSFEDQFEYFKKTGRMDFRFRILNVVDWEISSQSPLLTPPLIVPKDLDDINNFIEPRIRCQCGGFYVLRRKNQHTQTMMHKDFLLSKKKNDN